MVFLQVEMIEVTTNDQEGGIICIDIEYNEKLKIQKRKDALQAGSILTIQEEQPIQRYWFCRKEGLQVHSG